jgi:hypothetical protein
MRANNNFGIACGDFKTAAPAKHRIAQVNDCNPPEVHQTQYHNTGWNAAEGFQPAKNADWARLLSYIGFLAHLMQSFEPWLN